MAELLFPLQFKRQFSAPLDADAVFSTTAELSGYLLNPLRYAGQTVTCLEEEGKIFILNNAKDEWLEVQGTGSASVSGGVYQGEVICNTSTNVYTISHEQVDTDTIFPVTSLTIPASGSIIYAQGIFNRTDESFDVVLSGTPDVSGYSINWILVEAAGSGGTTVISGGSGSDAILIGGEGIEVNESPSDTWTISVSGDYATNSLVESVSGDLQTQIDNIVVPASDVLGTGLVDITAQASIIPDTSGAYDLGSPDKPWRSGYFTSSSIYLGDDKLSTEGGVLKVNDQEIQSSSSSSSGSNVLYDEILSSATQTHTIDIPPGNDAIILNAIVNAGNSGTLSFYINGDTTATNYYLQYLGGSDGNTTAVAEANHAIMASPSSGGTVMIDATIMTGSARPMIKITRIEYDSVGVMNTYDYALTNTSLSPSEITTITIQGTTSNIIGVDSRFIVRDLSSGGGGTGGSDISTSSIYDLADVSGAPATDGQVLAWSEAVSAYVPQDLQSSGGTQITNNGENVTTMELSGGIPTSLVPDASGVYDLGSPEKPWRSGYFTNETLYFGDNAFSIDETGAIKVNNTTVDPAVGVPYILEADCDSLGDLSLTTTPQNAGFNRATTDFYGTFNTSTSVWTAPRDMTLIAFPTLTWDVDSDQARNAYLRVNGVPVWSNSLRNGAPTSWEYETYSAPFVVKAGDEVDIYVSSSAGGHFLIRNTTVTKFRLLDVSSLGANKSNVVREVTLDATAQDISITGLRGYKRLRVEILAEGNSSGAVYMYVNGDTTDSNYRHQNVYGFGAGAASVTAETGTNPYIFYSNAGYTTNGIVDLFTGGNTQMIANQILKTGATTLQARLAVVEKTGGTQPDEITSIQVSHASANGFAAGTKVRIIDPEKAVGVTENYNTTETQTNKTWIDGKPIYRKVVDLGTLPDSTFKDVSHGITNLDTLTDIYGTAYRSDTGVRIKLPFADPSANASISVYWLDTTSVRIVTATNRNPYTESYIVLEYTKT